MFSAVTSTSISSRILLRSPCLRLANRPYPQSRTSAISSYLKSPSYSKRFYPRLARSESESHLKVEDAKATGPSAPPDHPSYLAEFAKEEDTLFERNAAKYLKQTGKAPLYGKKRSIEPEKLLETRYRDELLKEDPTIDLPKYEESLGRPKILKQIFFTLFVGLTSYQVLAVLTTDETHKLSAVFPVPLMTHNSQLRMLRTSLIAERLKKELEQWKAALSAFPQTIARPILWAYVTAANMYIESSEGRRVMYQICAMNGIVFLLWQLRYCRAFMHRSFLHHPLSGRSYTLLTSVFSHQSIIHLLANSFALVSFGSAATSFLQDHQAKNRENVQEATPIYHFWAFYICAGLFSSLTSHIVRVKFDYPRLLAKIRASAIGQNIPETVNKPSLFRNLGLLKKEGSPDAVAQKASRLIPASLGASGAIYSAVTLSALAYPNADVQLLFPPITMPISWGVGGMVMLDILGILRGWRLFDHWAHLSGALFGLFYYKYGVQIWDKDRALCEVAYLESEAEGRGGK